MDLLFLVLFKPRDAIGAKLCYQRHQNAKKESCTNALCRYIQML
jgi:hypothetical protein